MAWGSVDLALYSILPYNVIDNKILILKVAQNRRQRLATGGGPATLEVLTPAEDVAASTLCPEAIGGFGGVEVGGVSGN